MKKLKKRFISLVLSFFIVLNASCGAYAVPVVPLIYGGMAVFAAIAVACGLQTTSADDIKAMYNSLSDSYKNSYLSISNNTKAILAKSAVDQVISTIKYNYISTVNTVKQRYKGYNSVPMSANASYPVKLTTQRVETGRDGEGKDIIANGFVTINYLCWDNIGGSETQTVYSSDILGVSNEYYRVLFYKSLQSNVQSYFCVQYSSNRMTWTNFNFDAFNNYNSFITQQKYSFSGSRGLPKVKFAMDTNNNLTIAYTTPDKEGTTYNEVLKKGNDKVQILDGNVLTEASKINNIQLLDVDLNKVYNTEIDGTKSYTANQLTYNNEDIQTNTYTKMDPITKASSGSTTPGSNTGTAVDLNPVVSGLEGLKTQVNASNVQNYDFFGWLKTFLVNNTSTVMQFISDSQPLLKIFTGNTFSLLITGAISSAIGSSLTDIQNNTASSSKAMTESATSIKSAAASIEASASANQNLYNTNSKKINWSKLSAPANLLTTKFPFSLPWDFLNSFKSLSAEPEKPNWTIQFSSKFIGDVKIPLDFSIFDPIIYMCRGFELLLFDIGLILTTRKLLGGAE